MCMSTYDHVMIDDSMYYCGHISLFFSLFLSFSLFSSSFLSSSPTNTSFQLRVLYLNNNRLCLLDAFPRKLRHLSHLETLSLSHNLLESVPKSLCALPALQVLNLSRNRLTSLPVQIHLLKDNIRSLYERKGE